MCGGTPSVPPGGLNFPAGLPVVKFLVPRMLQLRKVPLARNKLPDKGFLELSDEDRLLVPQSAQYKHSPMGARLSDTTLWV